LTDQRFHNIGLPTRPGLPGIPEDFQDPGAGDALVALRTDALSSKGVFSDADDGRQSWLANDLSVYRGTFRTPTLRCVSRRPSFGHSAQFRTLEDVVLFFAMGGESQGFIGASENAPRDLSSDERRQLVAFLRALDGLGPDPDLVQAPDLPVGDLTGASADAGRTGDQ